MWFKRLLLGALVIALLAAGCGDDDGSVAEDGGPRAEEGASISALVIKAFETGDRADIDAVYAPAVRMVLDQETFAENRAEVSSLISEAKGIGNSYEQIGPVTTYTGTDGDLYVASIVEVQGPGHKQGDPLVGFYRVRDGKVIRHVFMAAASY